MAGEGDILVECELEQLGAERSLLVCRQLAAVEARKLVTRHWANLEKGVQGCWRGVVLLVKSRGGRLDTFRVG